jgi:hypothetical protein
MKYLAIEKINEKPIARVNIVGIGEGEALAKLSKYIEEDNLDWNLENIELLDVSNIWEI